MVPFTFPRRARLSSGGRAPGAGEQSRPDGWRHHFDLLFAAAEPWHPPGLAQSVGDQAVGDDGVGAGFWLGYVRNEVKFDSSCFVRLGDHQRHMAFETLFRLFVSQVFDINLDDFHSVTALLCLLRPSHYGVNKSKTLAGIFASPGGADLAGRFRRSHLGIEA